MIRILVCDPEFGERSQLRSAVDLLVSTMKIGNYGISYVTKLDDMVGLVKRMRAGFHDIIVCRATSGSAEALNALHEVRDADENASIVIASDTLVSLDGAPLGKPADAAEARAMLEALSGREHEVFSGVCVLDAATGRMETRVARTGVRFRAITDDEIDAYIATGEPMDKAGAYAIQGGAGAFVEALDGSFENVMGFPVDDVREMLGRFGR